MNPVKAFQIIAWLGFAFLPRLSGGQIFVSSGVGTNVGEYNLDGSPVNPSVFSGTSNPWGMAWDGNSTIYVANEGGHSVGEYTTSGKTVTNALINYTLGGDPMGVTLDGNGYLYVINGLNGTVGKFTTSGTIVNGSLITGLLPSGTSWITYDGNGHLFVGSQGSPTVAEYTTSGALVNSSFVNFGVYNGSEAAVVDGQGHIFIANNNTYTPDKIAEFNLDGTPVNTSLISGSILGPFGLALDGKGDIFVTSFYKGTVGEYTTSGETINASLISGLYRPVGIVIVPEPTFTLWMLAGIALFGLRQIIRARNLDKAIPLCSWICHDA